MRVPSEPSVARTEPGLRPAFHRTDSPADLAELDAMLERHGGGWWDDFYADKSRPVPFFAGAPDESLSEWIGSGVIRPGKALDLGCGNGRNAIFAAESGFQVEAVDFSLAAIEWSRQRALEAGVSVVLRHASVFELDVAPGSCDLVYDSGCFHHLAPHRRAGYIHLVTSLLRPGGWFGMTCFRPEGGSGFTDAEVYARKSLGGGLGYTEERLRELWEGPLAIRTLRQMKPQEPGSGLFGRDFLWALLAQRT